MPIQDIIEAFKGGGWAIAGTAVLVLLLLIFAPLIYITVLKGGEAHDRLLELIKAFRRPSTRRK